METTPPEINEQEPDTRANKALGLSDEVGRAAQDALGSTFSGHTQAQKSNSGPYPKMHVLS